MNFGDYYKDEIKLDEMTLSVKQIQLRSVCFCAESKINDVMYLHKVSINKFTEQVSRELVLRIQAHVLGYDHAPINLAIAATWWDGIKERFFPKWWLKRWPVRYEKFSINTKLLYPFIKPPITSSPFVCILERVSPA